MAKVGKAIVGAVALVAAFCTGAAHAQVSVARPAAAEAHHRAPTLGVKGAYGPDGRGWGKVRPKTLYNGGDINGLITHIHWSSWTGSAAHGSGKNAIFKPHGGYYRKPVPINLTATKLKVCPSTGKSAYSKLIAQEPRRPGGPEGKPFVWNHSLCKKSKY